MSASPLESLKPVVERCLDSLHRRSLFLFCGAGVSYDSGLPTVPDLTTALFEAIHLDPAAAEEVMAAGMPFEAIMESLGASAPLDKLLSLFLIGEPNPYHIVAARWAADGALAGICTTNFDLLFERALDATGLSRRDYSVCATDSDLGKFVAGKSDSPCVLKIHGSADDISSMVMTMRKVASRNVPAERRASVAHVFERGTHEAVLVLGYSCSDVFDVTPILGTLATTKYVVFVDHDEVLEPSVRPLAMAPARNPLRRFDGMYVRCDTRALLYQLADAYGGIPDDDLVFSTLPTAHWEPFVAKWSAELSDIDCDLAAGGLLRAAAGYETALVYLRRALERSRVAGRGDYEMRALGRLGTASRAMRRYQEALVAFSEAVELAERRGEHRTLAFASGDLGSVLRTLGDVPGALAAQQKGLQAAYEADAPMAAASLHTNLGNTYLYLGDHEEALRHFARALDLAREEGAKRTEANALVGRASVHQLMNSLEEAKDDLGAAISIAQAAGDRRTRLTASVRLAELQCHEGAGRVTVGTCEEAYNEAAAAGLEEVETEALLSLVVVLCIVGEVEPGVSTAQRLVSLARDRDDRLLLIRALDRLAHALGASGAREAAAATAREAIQLATQAGVGSALVGYSASVAAG